jgi:glycosyltransferase involved in cell wall biosynthesis
MAPGPSNTVAGVIEPPRDAKRIRVVFVDHVARLSGGEIALRRLLPVLAALVDVHVVLGEDGPLVEQLETLGIATEVMPLPERLRDVKKETVRLDRLDPVALASVPRYAFRLSRRIRALDADLVHTNSLKAALYAGLAARLAGVPVVWHIRDRVATDYLPASAVLLVRTASRLLPTAIVANSRATLETLPRARNGEVVYNPVVYDGVGQIGALTTRIAGEVVTVGIVGRLAPWKGQHVFLDGFAEAFRGTNVRGRVIGSALFGEDAYAASLPRRAARLGISNQIDFRGFRSDVWKELDGLDILVHCSVTPEPFGQVVLEGMAAGLAVVASAAGGPAEVITSGVDGILTPPDDVGELAAALRRLHEDSGLRERLGAAAQQRSRAFTPERSAKQLLAVYREILKHHSAGTRRRGPSA